MVQMIIGDLRNFPLSIFIKPPARILRRRPTGFNSNPAIHAT
jgi:hypothetical protein